MSRPATIDADIDAIIDGRLLGAFQMRVIAWCALLMGIDGYDLQVAAYTAPAIINEWMIDKASFGPVFAAGLAGYMIGALLISMAGDRTGRRPAILWTTLLFGTFTVLGASAESRDILLFYRLIAGIGLGGAIANLIALATEYAPSRRRAVVVAVLFAGYTGGAAVGGALSALIIPAFGWESAYILGGVLPLALLPLLIRSLPESPRFLARRGGAPERIRDLLARIAPGEDYAAASFAHAPAGKPGLPARQLFAGGRALLTGMLWFAFVASFLGHHFVTSWLPTLLDGMGVPLARAVLAGSVLQAGAFVGCLLCAATVDRHGILSIAVLFLLAAPLLVLIGVFGGNAGVAMVLIFFTGVCLIGGQIGLNALAAMVYETDVRATGAGWALGMGRIGAILGPLIGGLLLGAGVPVAQLFYWAALPTLICAGALVTLHRIVEGRGRLPTATTS